MKKGLLGIITLLAALILVGCDRREPLTAEEAADLHSYATKIIFVEENWENDFLFGITNDNMLLVLDGKAYTPKDATLNSEALLEIKNDFKDAVMHVLKDLDEESFSGWHAIGVCDFIHFQLSDEQLVPLASGDEFIAPASPFFHCAVYPNYRVCVSMPFPFEGRYCTVDMHFFVSAQNCPIIMDYFERVE